MVLHDGIRFRVVAQPVSRASEMAAHGREQAFAAPQYFVLFGQ